MTSALRRLRTFPMAAAIALYATAASSQVTGVPQGHGHPDREKAVPTLDEAAGMAGMPRDAMARMAALDARIRMLAADMHVFTGELKAQTMAALLDAVIERQSLMSAEMRRMHERMMHRLTELSAPPASLDEEPGTLCAPDP